MFFEKLGLNQFTNFDYTVQGFVIFETMALNSQPQDLKFASRSAVLEIVVILEFLIAALAKIVTQPIYLVVEY